MLDETRVREIAREEAQMAVASLAGLVMQTVQEAEEKGVSRAGQPLVSKGEAVASAFAEALGDFGKKSG